MKKPGKARACPCGVCAPRDVVGCGMRVWLRLTRTIARNGRPENLEQVALNFARDAWSCDRFRSVVGDTFEIAQTAHHALTLLRQREERANG